MSYWVYLEDEAGKSVDVDLFSAGGILVVGGDTEAALNVTYNYGWFYWKFLSPEAGLRWLNGKKASEVIAKLEEVVEFLGVRQFENYWAPTPGNAGYALSVLLGWAKENPDAVFRVH